MAGAMFRLLGAILKTLVVANTFGMFTLLIVFLFGGFLIPRRKCFFSERCYCGKIFLTPQMPNYVLLLFLKYYR
jgi:hypothetical protein